MLELLASEDKYALSTHLHPVHGRAAAQRSSLRLDQRLQPGAQRLQARGGGAGTAFNK